MVGAEALMEWNGVGGVGDVEWIGGLLASGVDFKELITIWLGGQHNGCIVARGTKIRHNC